VLPTVAIIGRPNVGKSSLFNRIIQRPVAIVEKEPGVTRDRLFGETEWLGKRFAIIDTGGIMQGDSSGMAAAISEQVSMAIEESDLLLFLADARDGLTEADREIAELIRRSKKPVILAVNKVDDFSRAAQEAEFYSLGLGDPISISAAQGLNIGDLLDRVVALLPEGRSEAPGPDPIKVCLAGRPNVGKSSLLNRLIGCERVLVDDAPGTTRDAVDVLWEQGENSFLFIDTAGMRRKGKIGTRLERYSVARALRAIERADLVLLVIDATKGVSEQDKRIAGYTSEHGKGCVIVVNKCDLLDRDGQTTGDILEDIRRQIHFMPYAPVMFVSAKTGKRVQDMVPMLQKVYRAYTARVSTSSLNRIVRNAQVFAPTPSAGGRLFRIYYMTQVSTKPPTFAGFVNDPSMVTDPYRRYLEAQLRDEFGFLGTPINFVWKRRRPERGPGT